MNYSSTPNSRGLNISTGHPPKTPLYNYTAIYTNPLLVSKATILKPCNTPFKLLKAQSNSGQASRPGWVEGGQDRGDQRTEARRLKVWGRVKLQGWECSLEGFRRRPCNCNKEPYEEVLRARCDAQHFKGYTKAFERLR